MLKEIKLVNDFTSYICRKSYFYPFITHPSFVIRGEELSEGKGMVGEVMEGGKEEGCNSFINWS